MISNLFHVLVYNPIYNALIYTVDMVPLHDVGIAVIIVTILVRLVLYPLSRKAIKTQIEMKRIAPLIEAAKEKHKDNPQEQSKAIFAIYKQNNVSPFSGILLLIVQLPILLGLYFVFARGGLPAINADILYAFVPSPTAVNMEFLGLINMAKPSILLGVIAAISQFIYTRLSMGPRGEKTATEASFSSDMARTFDLQARFMLPAMVGIFSAFVVAAAPLYWITGNIFMIGQELLAGRRFNGPKKD